MTSIDSHVQHTWNLTHTNGDDVTIDLWTDNYTVRVHGGPDDGYDSDGGLPTIEGELLPRHAAAGYRVKSDYAVNDPESHDDEPEEEPEGADQRPDQCPECGTTNMEYVPNHTVAYREGPAWMCTGCRWGQFIVA